MRPTCGLEDLNHTADPTSADTRWEESDCGGTVGGGVISSSIETMNGKEFKMKAEVIGESANISITATMLSGADEVTTGVDEVQEVPGLEGTQADVIEDWMTSTVEKRRMSNARTLKMSCSKTADE